MGTVAAFDPQSQIRYNFNNVGQLHEAIKTYNYIALRPDGVPYITQEFMGGYLLDGAPMNVYIEGQWFTGQKEILQPEWSAGRIPTPSPDILSIGAVPMPPAVQQNWDAYQNQGGLLSSIPVPVLIGGAALLAWKFLR